MGKNMSDIAFGLYNFGWHLVLPILKTHPRLKDGFAARMFIDQPAKPADLWIQAASAGEAYLAAGLIKSLPSDPKARILVTTNTRQGMEILQKAVTDPVVRSSHPDIMLTFFPFDQPKIMNAAVRRIQPKVMVLLESELWPGLLSALRRHDCRILIINGRMTPKSVKGYRLLSGLWKKLAPDHVLAISRQDADRFAAVFGQDRVGVMPNIKFDGVDTGDGFEESAGRVQSLVPENSDFLVFGSVRQEEESDILKMIEQIHTRFPDLVIGLFPRHMHRLKAWQQNLEKQGRKWAFRSALVDAPAGPGSVVLWDTFGELNAAYSAAKAVFVGGSLAPLGGQNFLEPLINGVVPVIGPSWENFFWIGQEVFSADLVHKTPDWQQAAAELIRLLENPLPRDEVQNKAAAYVRNRQGGTKQACELVLQALEGKLP